MIRLIGEGNVFDVSPAHSEMLILTMEYLLGRKLTKYKKQEGMYKKGIYVLEVLLEVKIYKIIELLTKAGIF